MFTTTDMVYDQIWQHNTEPFAVMDRGWKPSIGIAPNCPRCASANTKFCYYNNYSLSQPRYFCKGCRRYWTKGGSLRNVPIGGGCRKSRCGRSARYGQSQRGSGMNGFHSISTGVPNGESLLAEEGNESAEIDLAAVFAKFLNQSPSSVEEFDSEPHGSSSKFSNFLKPESVENEISNVTMLDCKNQSDPKLQMKYNFPVQELLPHEKIDDFVESDDGLCTIDHQLQDLVGGDELFQDVFWSQSDAAAASCGNFKWQPSAMQMSIPTGQLQEEMKYSLPVNHEDDYQSHVHSTMNMLNDNWGSFDLSSFEIFSRPIN